MIKNKLIKIVFHCKYLNRVSHKLKNVLAKVVTESSLVKGLADNEERDKKGRNINNGLCKLKFLC